jgi:hypothetical protein
MPPKTRKFLNIINEKLYRNAPDDAFLIFEEQDFTKAGFAVGEIEEMLVYLKREKVVVNYRSYSVSQDVTRLPIKQEEKASRLRWSWRELFAGENSKDRYALELVSRDVFSNFYNPLPGTIPEKHLVEKTIKNRLESEGLFVESRSQGEDLHLLIGKRTDKGEKAHVIIDGKTGEIRIEDNQKEPTKLVASVEAILTLPSGKKIKTSREAIKEFSKEEEAALEIVKIELDKEPSFNPITTTKDGLAHNFILMVRVLVKNLSDQKVSVRNIHARLTLPEGYQNGMFFTDLRNAEDLNGKDFVARTLSFRAEIINGANGRLDDQNIVWTENKNKILEHLASTKITLVFEGEYVTLKGTQPLSATFDITTSLLSKIKK